MLRQKQLSPILSKPSCLAVEWQELGNSNECIKAVLRLRKSPRRGYIIGYGEIKKKCGNDKTDEKPERTPLEIDAVHEGWIVIHFYLNKLEEIGYAIITNGIDSSKCRSEILQV